MRTILLSGIGTWVVFLAASAGAQPVPAPQPVLAPTPAVPAPVAVATPRPAEAVKPSAIYGRPGRFVRLRNDGNLVGRVMGPDVTEGEKPMRARVVLVQFSQVMHSVRSDDSGYFQISGVQPGSYSLVVAGGRGFTAFSVRVVAFQQQASVERGDAKLRFASLNAAQEGVPDSMSIEINSLIPPGDVPMLAQVLTEEGYVWPSGVGPGVVGPGFAPGMGAMGGGGAGGAGGAAGGGLGLGGLLGAAGLGAGLGGIGGQGGGGQPPASGSVPTP